MNKHQEQLSFASGLRTEILEADGLWLPRRDDLLAWLNGFIARVQTSNYELGETELADMTALNSFLRRAKSEAGQAHKAALPRAKRSEL